MALNIEKVDESNGIQRIYTFQQEQPDQKRLVYVIDTQQKIVTFYPRRPLLKLKEISIEGFDRLPREFHEKGYVRSGVEYYLNKKFADKKVNSFTISKFKNNLLTRTKTGYRVQLSYETLRRLQMTLSRFNSTSTKDRSLWVDAYLHELFPRQFKKPNDISLSERTRRVINQLDEVVIDNLDNQDIQIFVDFFEKLLNKRGMSAKQKSSLFESAKLKVDDITISEIIRQFEAMLNSINAEHKWGEYLRKNLFLIDARYINTLPNLNVQLGGTREMDFGLIDSQGYLDIFEIKLPKTNLLAMNPDRGNYYWHADMVKALSQAEKYLYNAERKGSSLAEGIKREKGLKVDVIRPRALLLIGTSTQLDTDNKREDFRVLRQSLKNIEVILYDELLERLKIQKDRIYLR